MRLRHKAHGVVVNVDDKTGARLLGGPWEPADKPAAAGDEPAADEASSAEPAVDKPPTRRPAAAKKKVTEDAGSGNDHPG